MRKLPKNRLKTAFNDLLFKVTTIVNIIIYYLLYSSFLFYFALIFIAQFKELTDIHFTMTMPSMITCDK